tara:strand:- start:9 stop:209 length:201 start_codon:yes stop_codon:yes gene_type:complete
MESNKTLLYNRNQYVKQWRREQKERETIYIKKESVMTKEKMDVYLQKWSLKPKKLVAEKDNAEPLP